MSEKPPIATVSYRAYEGHQLSLATAYLVRTPQGTCWAYASEVDIAKGPIAAGALQLDARHLELLPPQPDEPQAYLYRVVVHVRPREERMPPSLLAAARSKQTPTTRH
jgi:hypothetical protein